MNPIQRAGLATEKYRDAKGRYQTIRATTDEIQVTGECMFELGVAHIETVKKEQAITTG